MCLTQTVALLLNPKVFPMPTAGKTSRRVDPWISLVEAARLLKETRQTVLTRAVKGELEAQHIAGRTLISRASVTRCIENRK